jgi:hypothetical protein
LIIYKQGERAINTDSHSKINIDTPKEAPTPTALTA